MPVIAVAWPKADYLSALENAGATPRVISPETDPLPAALEGADGVLLTGGADVDPAYYNDDERHETLLVGRRFRKGAVAMHRFAHDSLDCFRVAREALVLGGRRVQLPSGRVGRED